MSGKKIIIKKNKEERGEGQKTQKRVVICVSSLNQSLFKCRRINLMNWITLLSRFPPYSSVLLCPLTYVPYVRTLQYTYEAMASLLHIYEYRSKLLLVVVIVVVVVVVVLS